MSKFIKLPVILFAILSGYIIGSNSNVNKNQNLNTVNKLTFTPTISPIKPLGFFTNVETSKGAVYLLIDQDYIYFNPLETAVNNNKIINIKKDQYPKLFTQGVANFSVLRAENYENPTDKKTYIKLSNSQPNHGGYSEVYSILVDPFSGEIKENN